MAVAAGFLLHFWHAISIRRPLRSCRHSLAMAAPKGTVQVGHLNLIYAVAYANEIAALENGRSSRSVHYHRSACQHIQTPHAHTHARGPADTQHDNERTPGCAHTHDPQTHTTTDARARMPGTHCLMCQVLPLLDCMRELVRMGDNCSDRFACHSSSHFAIAGGRPLCFESCAVTIVCRLGCAGLSLASLAIYSQQLSPIVAHQKPPASPIVACSQLLSPIVADRTSPGAAHRRVLSRAVAHRRHGEARGTARLAPQ